MKRALVLLGGGGHCKACIDVIEQSEQFNVVGILDAQDFVGREVLGYKIIGTDENLEELSNSGCEFLILLGRFSHP